MKVIKINGIISQDFEYESESNVTPASLGKSLNELNGEPVEIHINSPGGGVFAGLMMFSMIQNYPGETETRIVSLAASMGSVLALAGDKKTVENTALYYIHNAQGYGMGDYRDLLTESEFLKDVSGLIANLYAEYTTLTLEDAQELMDADSQFFGSDLELLGFETVQTGSEPSQAVARVNAKTRFEDVKAKMSKENKTIDLEKIAACLDHEKYGLRALPTGAKPTTFNAKDLIYDENKINEGINSVIKTPPTGNTPAKAGKNNREVIMTLSEFLRDNPTATLEFDNAIAEAGKAGETKGKADIEAKIKKAAAYFGTEYGDKIKAIAADVITGEKSVETLEAVVAVMDLNAEEKAAAAAKIETGELGDTPADQGIKTTEGGQIENAADMTSAVNDVKNLRGGGR